VKVAKRIPPQSAIVPRMQQNYEAFRRVYPATRSIYKN